MFAVLKSAYNKKTTCLVCMNLPQIYGFLFKHLLTCEIQRPLSGSGRNTLYKNNSCQYFLKLSIMQLEICRTFVKADTNFSALMKCVRQQTKVVTQTCSQTQTAPVWRCLGRW